MPPSLRPVPAAEPETARERAARLADDANHAAMNIAEDVILAAKQVVADTIDLPVGIPPGIRDELRRMGEEMDRRLTTVAGIRGRT